MGFEAFKIGVNLMLTGDADIKLKRFRLTAIRAAESVAVLNTRIKVLKGELLTLGGVVGKLNPRLNRFASELGYTSNGFRSTNASMTGFNAKLASSTARVSALSKSTAALNTELAGLTAMGPAAAASMGAIPLIGGRHSKRKGGGSGSSEGGRGGHGGAGLRIHGRTHEFGPVGVGFSPGYIGAAIAGYGVYKSYKSAKTYMQAQAEFAQLNLGAKTNKEADEYAKNLKLVGVSQIEALKTLRDSVVVMGDFAHAQFVAPIISKMQYANHALFSGTGIKIGESQYQDLLRVVEMRGGFKSEPEMKTQIDYMQRVMSGTGGRVLPNQYLNLMKTGGVAAQHLSNKALYFGLEPLIQEMGGFRVGTGLMSAYQAIQAGKMTTQAAIRWQELGLIKPGKAVYNKIGMIKKVMPGGVVGGDQAGEDIEGWVYNVYLPALKKHGIKKEGDILQEIAYDFGNRTAANLVSKIYLQKEKIQKNMKISEASKGSDASYTAAQFTPSGKEEALKMAASDLGVALGKLTMPSILTGLTALTQLIIGITSVVNSLNNIKFGLTPTDIEKAKTKPAESPFKNLFFHSADTKDENKKITIAPVMSQTIQVKSTINMDGKKVGDAVTTHVVNAASKVPNNTARFDTAMAPPPVLMKMGLY